MDLDQSKIRIGSMMQIQPDGPDAPKYVVHLIGFLKRKGICVTQPTFKGEMAMIREGQKATVRFFSGKDAFAFECLVLKQTLIPYPMLHLSYPKAVKVHQVRAKPRLQLDLIAVAVNAEREVLESLKISDLSTTGASLVTTSDLGDINDVMMLKFKITVEKVEKLMELNCQIRNVIRPTDEEKNYTYGVSFHDVPPAMMIPLSGFVANTTLDQL